MVAHEALIEFSLKCLGEIELTYKAAKPKMMATETLTDWRSWMFHSMNQGRIAKAKSVKILHAEMKYAAKVFTKALQVPEVGSQNAEGGVQDRTIPSILPMPATVVMAMMA